jgi:hypothetical protein
VVGKLAEKEIVGGGLTTATRHYGSTGAGREGDPAGARRRVAKRPWRDALSGKSEGRLTGGSDAEKEGERMTRGPWCGRGS